MWNHFVLGKTFFDANFGAIRFLKIKRDVSCCCHLLGTTAATASDDVGCQNGDGSGSSGQLAKPPNTLGYARWSF